MRRGIRQFRQGNQRAINRAVQTANTRSRAQFRSRLSGRPSVAKRDGRPTTSGNFARLITWASGDFNGNPGVVFQRSALSGRAPYWLIQEVGTGPRSASRILDTGEGIAIPSQRGRMLPVTLQWATAQGQYDVPRSGERKQQLRTLSDLKGRPFDDEANSIVIKKEIQGKRYLTVGGRQANEEYRDSLLQLARRTLERR